MRVLLRMWIVSPLGLRLERIVVRRPTRYRSQHLAQGQLALLTMAPQLRALLETARVLQMKTARAPGQPVQPAAKLPPSAHGTRRQLRVGKVQIAQQRHLASQVRVNVLLLIRSPRNRSSSRRTQTVPLGSGEPAVPLKATVLPGLSVPKGLRCRLLARLHATVSAASRSPPVRSSQARSLM